MRDTGILRQNNWKIKISKNPSIQKCNSLICLDVGNYCHLTFEGEVNIPVHIKRAMKFLSKLRNHLRCIFFSEIAVRWFKRFLTKDDLFAHFVYCSDPNYYLTIFSSQNICVVYTDAVVHVMMFWHSITEQYRYCTDILSMLVYMYITFCSCMRQGRLKCAVCLEWSSCKGLYPYLKQEV